MFKSVTSGGSAAGASRASINTSTRRDYGTSWAATATPPRVRSKRAAVEMIDMYRAQVDTLETTDVDGGRRIAFRIDALAKRVNAAARAEPVLDDVLVERVRAQSGFRRRETQLVARHEPQQRALALAHRAIAAHGTLDRAFDL